MGTTPDGLDHAMRAEKLSPAKRLPLLGALARRAGLGETFATEALGVVLQTPNIRAAFIGHLQDRLGIDLSHVSHIITEVDHREFGRTDVEGQDAAGRPVLIVEAKFAASLTVEQIARYLMLQAQASATAGLVLLMPSARVEDAAQLLRQAQVHAGNPTSAVACLSWPEILDVLAGAVPDDERGSDSLDADIIQLRALVDARTRFVLEPLGAAAAGAAWQSRRAELVSLVDLVTQRLADALGLWRGPQVARRDIAFAPSYYLSATGPVAKTYFSVGLHSGFASEGLTPLWLRFHKETGDKLGVKRVRELLGDSPSYGLTMRFDGGHLWIPVNLEHHLADEALADDVVRQIREILISAGAAPPDLRP